jgi:ankyrin repeat protein
MSQRISNLASNLYWISNTAYQALQDTTSAVSEFFYLNSPETAAGNETNVSDSNSLFTSWMNSDSDSDEDDKLCLKSPPLLMTPTLLALKEKMDELKHLDNKSAEFFEALLTQDFSKANKIIKLRAISPNMFFNESSKQTLLHWAVEEKQYELLEVLLDTFNLNINAQDEKGRTALHIAITQQDLKALPMLSENPNLNFSLTTAEGQTAEQLANESPNKHITHFLTQLQKHQEKSKKGNSPLHIAIQKNISFSFELQMEKNYKKTINLRNIEGITPLIMTIQNGNNFSFFSTLIQKKEIKLDLQDNEGNSALHYLLKNPLWNLYEMHETSLSGEKNKNQNQKKLFSAKAELYNWTKYFLNLKKNQYEVNLPDKAMQTPLHHAVASNCPTEIINLLLSQEHVNANAQDIKGHTPLHWAALNKQKGTIDCLLKSGLIDLNIRDKRGKKASDYWPQNNTLMIAPITQNNIELNSDSVSFAGSSSGSTLGSTLGSSSGSYSGSDTDSESASILDQL